MKPSPRQLQALTRFLADPDVRAYFQGCLDAAHDRLAMQDDPHIVRLLQGEARTYKAILKMHAAD